MTSANDAPWFCRFCSGPLPASGCVTWVDGQGPALTFCSQSCCDDFKAKTTRPDAPSSRRKRAASQ
ncbi:MAG TPA: hypothetical protein VHP33_01035 [Polyangiaceae bacterium]|nr:hypothetical protein [Polyangiaceae bacterium]